MRGPHKLNTPPTVRPVAGCTSERIFYWSASDLRGNRPTIRSSADWTFERIFYWSIRDIIALVQHHGQQVTVQCTSEEFSIGQYVISAHLAVTQQTKSGADIKVNGAWFNVPCVASTLQLVLILNILKSTDK